MDNTLVSARVPRAKKERGAGVLASIGATTSDLINSAFDYVIATKELPDAQKARGSGASDASGAEAEAEAYAAFVGASTIAVAWPQSFNGDYKQLASRMRVDTYEALDRH